MDIYRLNKENLNDGTSIVDQILSIAGIDEQEGYELMNGIAQPWATDNELIGMWVLNYFKHYNENEIDALVFLENEKVTEIYYGADAETIKKIRM